MKTNLSSDGRVLISRQPEERAPLLVRLRRVEGQVRGLIEMVETDRYCGDELQQIAAARAALREVAALLASQHVEAALAHALKTGEGELTMQDIRKVMRAAFRHG